MTKRTPKEIIGKDALLQLIFEDYAVVPVKPTQAMMDAALHDYMDYDAHGPRKAPWNAMTMWAAMLRALVYPEISKDKPHD